MAPEINILGWILMGAIIILIFGTLGKGFWNAVDTIALWLHQQAIKNRRGIAEREAKVNEAWINLLSPKEKE